MFLRRFNRKRAAEILSLMRLKMMIVFKGARAGERVKRCDACFVIVKSPATYLLTWIGIRIRLALSRLARSCAVSPARYF